MINLIAHLNSYRLLSFNATNTNFAGIEDGDAVAKHVKTKRVFQAAHEICSRGTEKQQREL